MQSVLDNCVFFPLKNLCLSLATIGCKKVASHLNSTVHMYWQNLIHGAGDLIIAYAGRIAVWKRKIQNSLEHDVSSWLLWNILEFALFKAEDGLSSEYLEVYQYTQTYNINQ